jgi:hypothetical protein
MNALFHPLIEIEFVLIFILFSQKMFPYSEQGERNGWHKVWCYTLSLVSTLLQSLGVAEKFVDQVRKRLRNSKIKLYSHEFGKTMFCLLKAY